MAQVLRVVTVCLMLAALVAVMGFLVYDLVPARAAPEATFSVVTLAWWQARPIVPLLVGLAIGIPLGHIGWPQRTSR